MSIVTCMISNLPNALEGALTSVIGADKAEAFVEALLPIIKSDKWSIFHPLDDIAQLKAALQKAADEAGIGWGTIAEVAISTATSVGEKCFSFDAVESYVEAVKNNASYSAELNMAVANAVTQVAKKQGYDINEKDLVNKTKQYANLPASESCTSAAWTVLCTM